ncbi:MAG: S8 family serine peptidase [bacterium]
MKKNISATARFVILSLCSFYFFGSFLSPVFSQSSRSRYEIIHSKNSLSKTARKISTRLRTTVAELDAKRGKPGIFEKTAVFSGPTVKVDASSQVQSYIHLGKSARMHDIELLKKFGIRIERVNDAGRIVQAWVPFDKFNDIAALDFVKLITPPDYAMHLTGSVNTEGDGILRADDTRNTFGIDGTGVRVGVISDGLDHRSDSQASGDLPANIEINPGLRGQGDEGTAMLEIVHDLAPGAQLAFSSAETSLEMIEAIAFLAETAFAGTGCDIIVDDLGFLAQPNFQDGSIAKEVERVVQNGVTYITAAGNQATQHYEANYVEGELAFQGNLKVHDFGLATGGVSDVSMDLDVEPQGDLTVVLQWNDPFPGSGNDYDLLLIDVVADTLVDISQDEQTGTQFPLEIARFTNSSSGTLSIDIVVRNLGASPKLLEIFFLGSNFDIHEYNVPEGSIIPGQQSAMSAISVGAISVLDPGNDDIEFFSSRGPVQIFFPTEEMRTKPNVSATDGNLITGAGGFGFQVGDNVRFFGTSSAAPHAAGVAALVLSANPSLTPAQVREVLANSAIDLGAAGLDNTFGAGRLDAFAAVSVVTSVETESAALPTEYRLGQNFPNPFNPTTRLRYTLSALHKNAKVKLEIFNALGQKVRRLVHEIQAAGNHSVEWDGTDDAGRTVATGIYFYRLQAGSFVEMKKMILLR